MKKYILIIVLTIATFLGIDYLCDRILLHGVNEFYGLESHSDILLIGHSHLMLATDKKRIEDELHLKVSKYTREGVNVQDRYIMVKQFLNSNYSDSLKICLYGVDLCTFTGEGLSQNSYKLFYPFMDDSYVDRYIESQTDCCDYLLHKIVRTSRYNEDGIKNASLRGWLHDWSNKKNGIIDIKLYHKKLENDDERHIMMNPELIETFKATINMLTDRGIRVILINTPTLDLLNNYEPDKFKNVVEWFEKFTLENDLVEYWDFNPQYSSRHEIFYDRLHLNAHGQEIITTEIINRLKKETLCYQ